MTLLLGALGLLALWWFGGSVLRLPPERRAKILTRWGAYAALGLGLVFLLRGRIDLALLFGLGGAWALDGPAALGLKAKGWLGRFRGQTRSGIVRPLVGSDGRISDGTVMAGPRAGQTLSSLTVAALRDLLAVCRVRDPGSARLLEAYLDGRHAGWRVDAQRDPNAGPRCPPDPGAMTQEEAYEILGLERGASLEEVRAAHRALMKRSHPDQGGTVEIAARVNAARDRLTNRHR